MKLSVRLARETTLGIAELKKSLESEDRYKGINLTNGFVVNQAYDETKDIQDWEEIINAIRPSKEEKENLDLKTNLTLSQATIDGINKLKSILPNYLEVSYVTTSFVIRIIVRAALILRDKANL